MHSEIPGLTPLWVIDFNYIKPKIPKTEGERLSIEIENMCKSLNAQCEQTAAQTTECKEKSIQIQKEIHHLHDVIDQFRNMLEGFYKDQPPSSDEPNP